MQVAAQPMSDHHAVLTITGDVMFIDIMAAEC